MKKSADFEASLAELEKVVEELDSDDVKLERALSLFESGMKLSTSCRKVLQAAEQQVAILKSAADGTLVAVPLIEEAAVTEEA
jgi:exodeoxyribonuclease VII small subunit